MAYKWLAVCAVLYGLAALRLPGYLHPDEHFQTLEWASYALGFTQAEQLPWEFGARIRPWLQPAVYAGLGKLVSPKDGFGFALACRLFTAAIAWLGLALLGTRFRDWFEDPRVRNLAWISSATFFLLPALRVRTSSESFGTALFMMSLALATRPTHRTSKRIDLVAGALLGLAFCGRYQLGFMGVGLIAWMAVIQKAHRRTAMFIAGAVLATGLGLCLDRWGYGLWQVTPWRYAYENIAAGRAASFGEHPWWAYAGFIWHDLPLPFSVLALLALPVALWRYPRHPLVWVNLPFIVGHALVGHKELRFVFPYLFFAPILATLAFGEPLLRLKPRAQKIILGTLLVSNLWWLGLDRHPRLSAGAWMLPLLADNLPLYHGNRDPFGQDGLHTWIYEGHRESTAMTAATGASDAPFAYYLYQKRPGPHPEVLETRCERTFVSPWPWAVFPHAWLTTSFGRRLFYTEHRHAVYRCPN